MVLFTTLIITLLLCKLADLHCACLICYDNLVPIYRYYVFFFMHVYDGLSFHYQQKHSEKQQQGHSRLVFSYRPSKSLIYSAYPLSMQS